MAKLTATSINKKNQELSTKRTIYVLGDQEVIINNTFKDSSIDKIVVDYLSIFESTNKDNSVDDEILRGLVSLLPVLILREFSNVPMIPKTNSDIKKLISIAYILYDTGILEEVLNAFDQEQVQKVYTKLDVASKRVGEVMSELAIKSTLSQTQGDEEIGDSEELQGIGEIDQQEDNNSVTE